jgi:leucyl/phenylalanyl-tRNA--protein transferase
MLYWLDDDTPLPPGRAALGPDSDAPGLVAAGGRVTPERLEEAYRKGIFPWYASGQPVLWWSPDPRMVLPTPEFRVSHSLRKTLRRFVATPGCEVRVDSAFEAVIHACAATPREGQDGTWIVPAMIDAYLRWHRRGHVHSVETWIDGALAGGLYCVAMAREHGVALIDCQQNTHHLASLGAREIARRDFEAHLAFATAAADIADWTYHATLWRHLALDAGAAPQPDRRRP